MEAVFDILKGSIPALLLAVAKILVQALLSRGGITPMEQSMINFIEALEALINAQPA